MRNAGLLPLVAYKHTVETSEFTVTSIWAANSSLGPVYIERQRQRCDVTGDTALIDNNEVAP